MSGKSAQEQLAEKQLEQIERREQLEKEWERSREEAEERRRDEHARCPGGDPDWCGS